MVNSRTAFTVRAVGLAGLLPACAAMGHHAATAYFDTSRLIEVRGVITEVKWQNPHIGFTLVSRANGEEVTWLVESESVSTLSRHGITADQLTVGDLVTVAGFPPRQDRNRIMGNYVLFSDGRELVLHGSERYFSEGRVQRITVAEVEARDVGNVADLGMFRVWSTITGDPSQDRLWEWERSYPLTEAARSAQAAWDPLRENPVINCEPQGMPGIMAPPYPMELSDQGEVIILRQEQLDSIRTIYMDPAKTPADPEPTVMGHSVGRWEGDTLVVDTTGVSYPWFDMTGIPQSDQIRFVERFSVSSNGRRLYYTIDATDPETFTEPVRLDRFWVWIPEARVEPFNCTPLEGSATTLR